MKPGSIVITERNWIESPSVQIAIARGLKVNVPLPFVEYTVRDSYEWNVSGHVVTLIRLEEVDNSHLCTINDESIEPGFNIIYFKELLPPLNVQEIVDNVNTGELALTGMLIEEHQLKPIEQWHL